MIEIGLDADAARLGHLGPPYRENLSELNKVVSGDSIRLLKVLIYDLTRVVCHLQVFPLQEAPPFAALSYCWGKKKPDTHALFVNGPTPMTPH